MLKATSLGSHGALGLFQLLSNGDGDFCVWCQTWLEALETQTAGLFFLLPFSAPIMHNASVTQVLGDCLQNGPHTLSHVIMPRGPTFDDFLERNLSILPPFLPAEEVKTEKRGFASSKTILFLQGFIKHTHTHTHAHTLSYQEFLLKPAVVDV